MLLVVNILSVQQNVDCADFGDSEILVSPFLGDQVIFLLRAEVSSTRGFWFGWRGVMFCADDSFTFWITIMCVH